MDLHQESDFRSERGEMPCECRRDVGSISRGALLRTGNSTARADGVDGGSDQGLAEDVISCVWTLDIFSK